ncbi:helix-turn-helix transcriptional regulator [Pseudomonas sp. R2.Fl]|nr:helix-turn-helix transcriptional regulator [Pseudomonas sp. R2.Fl]
MTLTPELVGAARALAKISREQLAERAGLPLAELAAFEEGLAGLDADAETGLRRAIEHFGVELLPEEGSGVGIRLKFTAQETGQILNWEGEGGKPGEDEVP